MRNYRTADPEDKREYPLVITAEEKDKVLNAILVTAKGSRDAELFYEDIPGLEISNDQYEMVLAEFKKKGLVDYTGYGYEQLTLSSEISNFAQKGGFTFERDLYILQANVIEQIFQKMEKELTPNTAAKVNSIIEKAKTLSELALGLKELHQLLSS